MQFHKAYNKRYTDTMTYQAQAEEMLAEKLQDDIYKKGQQTK